MQEIPEEHPRYFSLITREKISMAVKKGIAHETGLIAHGRGEAFDYLIGEKTIHMPTIQKGLPQLHCSLRKNQ